MDGRKSKLNVSISIVSRIILLAAAFLVRRLVIRFLGNDINGLNSLYTSIIGVLSIAELGVGGAIIFSMYSPIVAGDKQKVAALYGLYKKLYRIIGAVILGAGLLVMPFLPRLIGDYDALKVNVYLTFFLTLVSVVLSYLYSAKTSLIQAYKDNYITTGILTVSRLVRNALQIDAILIWKSDIIFVICQILDTLLVWALTEAVVRRRHGDIIRMREKVDAETKTEVSRNVKAMFMHQIGSVMVSTVDSLIISGYTGVSVLGRYANYTSISDMISGTIILFFSPLHSVVGHFCVSENQEKRREYFYHFYFLNYILGIICYLGFFSIADSLVLFLYGPGLEMSRSVVFIIALNSFTQYMRRSILLFRDASGSFYYDRWKAVAEGAVNILLSLLLVNILPASSRVAGVILATIITTLLICDTVEPFVIFRHVFGKSPKKFWLRNYAYIALYVVCLLTLTRLAVTGSIVLNGLISIGMSAAALGLLFLVDRFFRSELRTVTGMFTGLIRHIFRKI